MKQTKKKKLKSKLPIKNKSSKSSNTSKSSSKSKKNKNLNYNNTFILAMRNDNVEYITDILRNMLLDFNLTETKNPNLSTSYIHFQHIKNTKYDASYYNTPTLLMNILDDSKEVITNKSNLYFNFHKKFPAKCAKYMAKTWDARKFPTNKFNNNSIYIVRPVGPGAFSGFGIKVLKTEKELDIVLKNLKLFPKVIISEYINPMLWEGKKFHIRAYFLVKIIDNVMSCYFYDFYEIFTAEKPYKQSDWGNKDIHDTHLKSAKKYILGPNDFDNTTKKLFNTEIFPKMKDCMFYVSKIMDGNAKPFDNSKNAYEVFGCDFMVDNNYNVILMEVNKHTGLSMADFPDRKEEFSRIYFSKINDLVLEPYFTPNKSKNIKPLYESKN